MRSSTRGTGYVDQLYLTAFYGRTYYIRLYCASGTCAFSTQIGKGDSTAFTAGGIYLNQRSFVTRSGKCVINGVQNDGECMCAPSSSAMAIVMAGKRPVSALRSVAVDLYTTNSAGGSANRAALKPYLEANYGYSCSETYYGSSMLSAIKTAVLHGRHVTFRSPVFSGPGHYVQVRGYSRFNGRDYLLVNDPNGAWASPGLWSPKNGTDPRSAAGDSRYYDYLTINNSNASVIVCN